MNTLDKICFTVLLFSVLFVLTRIETAINELLKEKDDKE